MINTDTVEMLVNVSDTVSLYVKGPLGDTALISDANGDSDTPPIVRRVPRIPSFTLESVALFDDLITQETEVKPCGELPSILLEAGDLVPTLNPADVIFDAHGNTYRIVYRADAGGNYYPALALISIDPQIAIAFFVAYAQASRRNILDADARTAAAGTHLRRAQADKTRAEAEARRATDAARTLVESLNTTLAFQRARAELHQRQAKLMRSVLVQYASPESWTRETEGQPALKLISSGDGYALADSVLKDVAVAEAE